MKHFFLFLIDGAIITRNLVKKLSSDTKLNDLCLLLILNAVARGAAIKRTYSFINKLTTTLTLPWNNNADVVVFYSHRGASFRVSPLVSHHRDACFK